MNINLDIIVSYINLQLELKLKASLDALNKPPTLKKQN